MEVLYREHGEAVLRYLRRSFGSCAMAEDLLQETFVRAMGRREEIVGAESPRAFLFGIARHVGLTAARRAKVRRMEVIGEVAAKSEKGGEEKDEALEAMRRAIGRLPDQLQETLEFRLREELSYEEIAGVMGIPVGTVRSRLHTALRMLKEDLKKEEL